MGRDETEEMAFRRAKFPKNEGCLYVGVLSLACGDHQCPSASTLVRWCSERAFNKLEQSEEERQAE